ncbi:imelysin [Aliarcobacter trophiarum LMG 25534]|uniref:Imelysin n=1 Tax=Aliarcobacter trophiarum LMG 25534 TaxID=1032241 RepID=A0AAD0QIE5_9BACT|nr:imelysin family protein [Aliarcobacter trophiarum]AXK48487.1 peptidase, M75 family [Aliarcobacter trophiarum LMG 25534]RXJ89981.1 imelysin [Aliarcobacter trophiarum LMG 25534]
MKKIFLMFLFLFSSVFANETIFQSVIKNIALKDTKSAIESAKNLQKEINSENFTKFLKDWKRVETNYLAGEINSDYLDTPRYIDVFNNLKEDLNSQMKRVVDGDSDIKKALFKNSFKTINALEYVIFSSNDLNDRKKEISKEILSSIIKNLEEVKAVYENYLKNPVVKEDDNAKLLNALVASSYRLKEWRVGNPSGLSAKYKNDFKNSRAEYFLSQNSFASINAILDAQKEMISNENYINLLNLAKEKKATNDLEAVVSKIDEAKKELNSLPKDDFTNAKKLFDLVSEIHDLYYITIIEKLGLKPEILDADGD